MNAKRGIIVLGLLSAASMPTWAQQIKGVVIDQKSKETLIGAVVTVDGTNVKTITNIDGNFQIDGLDKEKTYTLYINYVGYKTQKIDGVQAKDADQVIALQPDEQQLKEVTVTAVERRNTDAAMIQVAKNSPVIVSNVSAQEISRTQDTNAGEVIRRVPGVSLIDDALESGVYALSTGNDISREWTQLDEHIFSLGVNDKHHFKFGNFEPDLKVGVYGEYRSREYQTRNFINSVALGWPIGLFVEGEKGETVKDAKPSYLQSRATSILIHGPHWLVQMAILLSQEAHCSVPQVSPAGQVSTQ